MASIGALRISVVIPVYNEELTVLSCIEAVLSGLGDSLLEVLVVDSASKDSTGKLVEGCAAECEQVRYLISPESGRSAQLNYGAKQAEGNVFLFVHADTLIGLGIEKDLRLFFEQKKVWGFCPVRFDSLKAQFRMLAFMINLRSRLTQISTGDQSQFITRQAFFLIDGYPSQPLMEDVEFSKALKRESKPFISKACCKTASRKWESEGFWRTVLLMWRLRYRYWRGANAAEIHRVYYRS